MKIYAGNLPHSMKEEELKELFSQFGEVVSVSIIMDRETGQSKGFGFVEFSSSEDAQKAIEELNGTEVKERVIKVDKAQAKSDRPGRGNKFGPRRGGQRGGGRGFGGRKGGPGGSGGSGGSGGGGFGGRRKY